MAGCGPTMVVDRTGNGAPILIRSPQPDADEIRRLHQVYGLTTVINLRGADVPGYGSFNHEEPAPSWWLEEKRACRELGISFWTMNLNDGTKPPSDNDIQIFFRLIQSKDAWPILIHCQGGIHRAGLMTALYRMQFQKWSSARAIREMESHWFNWSISNRSEVKNFLRYFRRDPSTRLPR